MIPFSILDLAPVPAGAVPAEALRNSLDLAQHAERLGYRRYWVAEHHSMPGIASAATSVVVGYLAGGTKSIRVGAGGIMLPNHAPLVIAEQFGTLESLYPGRIDLGLGRAPGTDTSTTRALRRDSKSNGDDFPQLVEELRSYFAPISPGQRVRAVPGAGLNIPIWILGSSLFGAQLAAQLGLPFAFASHFAPGDLLQAAQLYRAGFRASAQLQKPHMALGINVVAAESDRAAQRIFTSHQQAFVMLRRGAPGQIPAPIDDIGAFWTPAEQAMASQSLLCSAIGSAETVARKLQKFIEVTEPDELFITGLVYKHADRLRSYEIVAELRKGMAAGNKEPRLEVAL
ncbi:MAG: LLM class flavin-dependent oxidoreductase [Candidatus Acidiferrum sp.]|jgi:luciferase family oxidoreductase group 1